MIALIEKPVQPLSDGQLWGEPLSPCVSRRQGPKLTTEEQRLYDAWRDRLVDLGGAQEKLRFAGIALQQARDAVQRACFDYESLRRANAARCGVLDAAREGEGEAIEGGVWNG